jgi:hypothetical protein
MSEARKLLVTYEPTPLPGGPCKTVWGKVVLPSGAEVRVGLQSSHPHGGYCLVHDLRNTQPDTGKRTQLRFGLSIEAAAALVALYAAHGVVTVNTEHLGVRRGEPGGELGEQEVDGEVDEA